MNDIPHTYVCARTLFSLLFSTNLCASIYMLTNCMCLSGCYFVLVVIRQDLMIVYLVWWMYKIYYAILSLGIWCKRTEKRFHFICSVYIYICIGIYVINRCSRLRNKISINCIFIETCLNIRGLHARICRHRTYDGKTRRHICIKLFVFMSLLRFICIPI